MEKIVSFQLQRASPDHSHAKTFKNIAAQSHSLNFSRTLLANLTDSQTVCKIYMLARVYFLLGTEIVAKSSAGHKGGARGRRGGPPPSSVLSPACALHPSLQPPAESLAIATPDSPGVGLLSVMSLSGRFEDFSDFFKLSV